MRIQSTRDRILTIGDLGAKRVYSGKPGAGGGADWWDPNNVGLSCVGAYRAINSIGTPWADGPANYAASLVNNVTPGVARTFAGNDETVRIRQVG